MLLEIPLDFMEGGLYRQITSHLEKMIHAGSITPGSRLPGTRELAKILGVSRSTVVEAYCLLEEKGLIIQKGRSGAFVSPTAAHFSCVPVMPADEIHFDQERPTPDLIPFEPLAKIAREVLIEDEGRIMGGCPPEGMAELRMALLEHAVLRGIPACPEEVVVTSGGKDALSTVLCSLKKKGAGRIYAEILTYSGIKDIARNEGMALRHVPLLADGDISMLENLGERDILYLVPSFHNPTGRTLSTDVRKEILALRKKRGFHILEDDSYGELRYGEKSVPAMKALDEGEGVIYIGSFSQVLFPGMRLGYIVLPAPLKECYIQTAALRQGQVSSLVQLVVWRFIKTGNLSEAIERARSILSVRMDSLYSSLIHTFPRFPIFRPEGGVFLWFPTGNAEGGTAAALASSKGVYVSDGGSFSLSGKRICSVRFSIASASAEKMEDACLRLAGVWKTFR
ncbi:MAG: PLP-dependent aminotransferase family protein [Synergistaceae bacterium]|jgi:DNA-binding transcriptional MocR family regulator|nr:PLP-dependent aminotransferase family protein [Synergistaceae bacterium]NLO57231.1 PLP-dependent aminotransferase family protein [Synergistaceae bacterium]